MSARDQLKSGGKAKAAADPGDAAQTAHPQVGVIPKAAGPSASEQAYGGDSLAGQGEEQQLKMQMTMDRMTKADQAASNVMHETSDTQSDIIGNFK